MSVVFKYYKWEAKAEDGTVFNCESPDGKFVSAYNLPKPIREFKLIPQRESLPPVTVLLDEKRKLLFERIWTKDALAQFRGEDISCEITRIGWTEDEAIFSLFIYPDGFVQVGGVEPDPKFAIEYYTNLRKYT